MMKQITPHVYAILTTMGYLNSYIIQHDGIITLVDTGTGAGFVDEHIEPALKALNTGWDAVRYVVITHEHYDHVGGLAAIQERANPTTFAHRLGKPIIEGEKPDPFANPDELNFVYRLIRNQIAKNTFTPARVDRTVEDSETLDEILAGTVIYHLPGHAHGQIGLYLASEKTLIAGDLVIRTPFGLRKPLRFVSPDWAAVSESIKRVSSLAVDNLCIGHGQPIVGGAEAKLRKFADSL